MTAYREEKVSCLSVYLKLLCPKLLKEPQINFMFGVNTEGIFLIYFGVHQLNTDVTPALNEFGVQHYQEYVTCLVVLPHMYMRYGVWTLLKSAFF